MLLEARGLKKSHCGTTLLDGVNLTLYPGEMGVLLGPAGSGKTTLLAMLGCLLAPDEGELRIAGQRVDFSDPETCALLRRACIGFIAQRAPVQPFAVIEQHLAAVAENNGLGPAAACDRARELLFRVGLAGQIRKYPTELERGQLQRLGVAHALVNRPRLLLADDPTADLEPGQADALVNLLLAQARASGAGLLMVTHNPQVLSRFDRIFTLDAGRLRGSGAFHRPLHCRAAPQPVAPVLRHDFATTG
jgi:putative ABC transport system ATP-binding protein